MVRNAVPTCAAHWHALHKASEIPAGRKRGSSSKCWWSRRAKALPIHPSTLRVERSRTTRSAMVRMPGRCLRMAMRLESASLAGGVSVHDDDD
eukprot:158303-Chlamydomonas_euryale.AAC.1